MRKRALFNKKKRVLTEVIISSSIKLSLLFFINYFHRTMKRYISGPSNAAFPLAVMVLAGVFLFCGFAILGESGLIGLIMIVAACLVLLSRYGYEIDVDRQLARSYTSIFGIKSGKWTDISSYSQVSILSTRMNTTAYSRTNRSTSDHYLLFRVCLLDDTHLRKVLVYESQSKGRAEAFLKDMIQHMAIKHVRYSPKKLKRQSRR